MKFLRSEAAGRFGAIISYIDGQMVPLPFEEMIVKEVHRQVDEKK